MKRTIYIILSLLIAFYVSAQESVDSSIKCNFIV
ncbi:MAG: hypothetical protein EZS26_002742 [Candidatus Ordinivivax streblomastigis]|uniref:Uncharacterized protein n=1 Tax=Candidatus Ordinivivax streblomastigis TaxID=2540710 RepID=A0A5M8NY70_9BACT|nr:MAG: hypothetical protein EZS26_002742 [Candidatus Ordinivivax streblomastigis]